MSVVLYQTNWYFEFIQASLSCIGSQWPSWLMLQVNLAFLFDRRFASQAVQSCILVGFHPKSEDLSLASGNLIDMWKNNHSSTLPRSHLNTRCWKHEDTWSIAVECALGQSPKRMTSLTQTEWFHLNIKNCCSSCSFSCRCTIITKLECMYDKNKLKIHIKGMATLKSL